MGFVLCGLYDGDPDRNHAGYGGTYKDCWTVGGGRMMESWICMDVYLWAGITVLVT